jgi:hypothetical protein
MDASSFARSARTCNLSRLRSEHPIRLMYYRPWPSKRVRYEYFEDQVAARSYIARLLSWPRSCGPVEIISLERRVGEVWRKLPLAQP